MEKKKNEIIIINKFKDNENSNINILLEQAFKMYYEMQINKVV